MDSIPLLDSAGRRRSPATLAIFHLGRAPRNKVFALSVGSADGGGEHRGHARRGNDPDGIRLRGSIVVLWRAAFDQRCARADRDRR